jgi:dGTPase
MKEYGGFSHNAHALKIITKLEQLYASYDGLNLTWEVLEGIAKHNGPLRNNIPEYVLQYNSINNLDLENYPSAEAQLASLSDDITYICHDLEDSIRAKIIDFSTLSEIEFIDKYVFDIKSKFNNINSSRLIYEVVRKLAHDLIESLLLQTKINLKKQKIESPDDIRMLSYQLVDFPQKTQDDISEIKQFLLTNVYRHHYITSITSKCHKIINGLFKVYMDNPDLLPFSWQESIDKQSPASKALITADYIAGMTDRFAIKEYESFYNLNFNNI